MEARANDINILENYKVANPEERFEIMFAHYSFFPKVIRKLEKKTQFKIKAEREYMRSHNRGELGVRVQNSNISSPTEDEAIANIEIEEAFKTGEIDSSLLKGIDNATQYEENTQLRPTFAVFGGIAEIGDKTVNIFSTIAQHPEEIDLERAEADRQEVEATMQEETEELQIQGLQVLLRRSLVRIEVSVHMEEAEYYTDDDE